MVGFPKSGHIYDPLIDYIRSHVCLCAVLLHVYIIRLPAYVTGGSYIVWHACKPNLYAYARSYNGIKVGWL